MEISDIQLEEDKVAITFCSIDTCQDIVKIIISKKDAWQVSKFCQDNLSYGAMRSIMTRG